MAAWIDDAACRREDPELFFPIGTSAAFDVQVKKAKAVCGRCPVRGECLNWALGGPEKFGIWGGLTEDERAKRLRSIKRRRAARMAALERERVRDIDALASEAWPVRLPKPETAGA